LRVKKEKKKSNKEIKESKLEGEDIYKREKDGEFIYESFHLSMIFLCNGKIYTLGYGSDPFADEEELKKGDKGDPNTVRLKKIENFLLIN